MSDESLCLQDLTADEKLALVALLKLVVRADRELSSPEVEQLNEIARAVGVDEWHELVGQARGRFRSERDVRQFAERIERRTAQRLIYRQLVRAAKADGLVAEELSVLIWLATLWRVG